MAAAVAGAFFARTRLGLALRALAEQPAVAHAMGIDARRYFELAWVLAGIIAVVGGVLWSALRGPGFGLAVVSLKVFPIVIIGGLDSLAGAFAGGLAVGVLESLAATYLDVWVGGGFSTIASFLLLIPVLVLRPQGMFGTEQVERV
jgi:branched-chain amino acid transport system permease protein